MIAIVIVSDYFLCVVVTVLFLLGIVLVLVRALVIVHVVVIDLVLMIFLSVCLHACARYCACARTSACPIVERNAKLRHSHRRGGKKVKALRETITSVCSFRKPPTKAL